MKDPSKKYLEETRKIILNLLDDPNVRVFLFGSRTSGQAGFSSDIDVGFSGFQESSQTCFRKIRMALEESRVPYHVDLVDFDKTSDEFKTIALKNVIKWN
ncbi:MAG: nucleotidyltransferase domain-containing protein [Proteobacteria bacterium]|nr:nucleotidyltransferase domain-containing protein [Pseudomonadota bacterium]